MIFILIIFITTPVSPKLEEGWQGFFDDQYGNVNQKKDEILSGIAFCFLFPKEICLSNQEIFDL